MPNSESAKKRVRQNEKARLRNRARSSALKTALKRVDQAAESGDAVALAEAVKVAYKRIDKAAQVNILHANTAARRKSLVMRKLAAATAAKA